MSKRGKATEISKLLGISKARGMEAVIKAELIAAVTKAVERLGLTHEQVASAQAFRGAPSPEY